MEYQLGYSSPKPVPVPVAAGAGARFNTAALPSETMPIMGSLPLSIISSCNPSQVAAGEQSRAPDASNQSTASPTPGCHYRYSREPELYRGLHLSWLNSQLDSLGLRHDLARHVETLHI